VQINAIRATIDLRYTKIDEIYEGFSEFGFGKIGSEGAKNVCNLREQY